MVSACRREGRRFPQPLRRSSIRSEGNPFWVSKRNFPPADREKKNNSPKRVGAEVQAREAGSEAGHHLHAPGQRLRLRINKKKSAASGPPSGLESKNLAASPSGFWTFGWSLGVRGFIWVSRGKTISMINVVELCAGETRIADRQAATESCAAVCFSC